MNYPKNRHSRNGPWVNKEWLYDQYIVQDKRSKQIAEENGCKQSTIQMWLYKHGIKKEITTHYIEPKHYYETYNFLYQEHIVKHKSMATIAKENNIDHDIVHYYLRKNKIPIWQENLRKKYTEEDIQEMKRLYLEEHLSANQISKIFSTSHGVIINYLKENGVETRNWSESQFNYNNKIYPPELFNKKQLYRWHWEDGLSCKDIGEILGIEAGTVRRWMKKQNIPTKNNSQSKVGLMVGEKHPNYKGGISSLNELLREFFQTNQAPAIAKRDNYTCQLCGATHTILHVHHIKQFHIIVEEICAEYPYLNPSKEEDKYQLYKIITEDPRFLDENNLITFCKDCHFYKIHEYNKTISSQASYEEGSETIF